MVHFNKFAYLVLLFFIASHFTAKASANCACKEKGTDYCSSCTDRRIVRPQVQPYQESEFNLPPIGDNCGCNKQLVEPAPLPKMPCPKLHKPKCGCKTVTNAVDKFPVPFYPNNNSPTNYNYVPVVQNQDNSPPADPVSVSLAVQAETSAQVPEAWTHGRGMKPVDQQKKVVYSLIPEEKLFGLNSEVISLPKYAASFSYKQEDVDDYVEDIERDLDAREIPQLTYRQLGYRVEQINEPKFRTIYTQPGSYNNFNTYEVPIVQYNYDNRVAYKPTIPARKCVACHKNPHSASPSY